MNTPIPEASPARNARTLLKTLQENFPVFRDCAPLAIGIDKQLLSRQPELDRKVLRIALGIHTHSLRYLKTVEKGTHRLDLDGAPVEELTEAHRTHATETLRERYRKDAERRKAQREAEMLERQRAQKMNLLIEKFGRK